MIKGIIFDLDGVLVSTDEMHYLAWKRLADELQITGFTREDNRRQRGVSRMASLEIVLEKRIVCIQRKKKRNWRSGRTNIIWNYWSRWTNQRYLRM